MGKQKQFENLKQQKYKKKHVAPKYGKHKKINKKEKLHTIRQQKEK